MGEEMDDKARKIARKLRKHLNAEKILLFGSRARGDYLKHSDYDFIIVSKAFEGVKFPDRQLQATNATGFYSADYLCYTPTEFNKKKTEIGIVRQAVEEGVSLP